MSEMNHTFPASVQPGIPRLGPTPDGWTRVRLGKLFEVHSRPIRMSDNAEYDLITVKRSRGGIERRSRMKGREISVKSQFEIREGDFVISKRQIVHGACAIVPAEFLGSIVSNEYAVLRCRPALDPEYLRWLVHSLYVQQTFFHSSIGVHVEKMIFRLEEWFRWQIDLPPVDEQRRRAASMNALHTRLEGLRREQALLGDYKTGLMQRIFSRDIRFRADDGSAFPEWREMRLRDIVQFSKGRGISKEDIVEGGATPCIRYGQIYTDYGEVIRAVISSTNSPSNGLLLSQIGDVLIPASGEDPNDMARACAVMLEGVALGGDINVLRGTFDGPFMAYYLSGAKRREIARVAQGNSVVHLYGSHLANLRIELPHPEEQRKIADALGAIDSKIDAVATQIDQLETFKRGLLQKMFV